MIVYLKRLLFPSTLILLIVLSACARRTVQVPPPRRLEPPSTARSVGYAIQVGAFSRLANASRLTRNLMQRGVEAYYFRHSGGLYKVRFGNFTSRNAATREAERLLRAGTIPDYYVVSPEDYPVSRPGSYDTNRLRTDLVTTAESFIGLPYQWGGSSPEEGFDCSGLSKAVYELNGLQIPRSSWQQYREGAPVRDLKPGDLVFFRTNGTARVSHVGIYIGANRFIHAPAPGKTIRRDSLASRYYNNHYAGARTYLR